MPTYTRTISFKLDVTGRASNLRAQLYDPATGATVGGLISTGFVELATSGSYAFTGDYDDSTRYAGMITDTGDAAVQIPFELNFEDALADVRISSRSSHSASDAAAAVRTNLSVELARIDAEVSTRSSHTAAQVRAEMDSNSAQLAAIVLLVDTVESSLSTVLSRLTAVRAGYIDNIGGGQIALAADAIAIKSKTDNLPAAPAAVGSAMTLADGSISAATILDNAITSAKLAASAITAIKDGLATATSVADLQTILAKVNALIEPDGAAYRFNTNALELAPTGAGGGGLGTGTGNIRVNHTYGATVSDPTPLRFVYGTSTAGVDNGWVRAFLKSEYDLGLRIGKGETRTKADGTWAEDLLLDAAEYYIEFRTPDERKAVLQTVTVVAEA